VVLSSLSDDPRHSEEGEILRAMEHVPDKAEKFPEPSPGIFHVILSDTRGYAIGMADRGDFREIAFGTSAVAEEQAHYWNGRPILGLFDRSVSSDRNRSAAYTSASSVSSPLRANPSIPACSSTLATAPSVPAPFLFEAFDD